MRKLILLFVFVISGVCLGVNAYAARSISLPYSTDFTTNDISDLVWTANGGTVTYSTNGWSGGAVKITPPTSAPGGNGTYSCIGYFEGFSTSRINIRLLMKIGPTYTASHRGLIENKFIDVQGTGGGESRKGILTLNYDGGYHAFAVYPLPSHWNVYRSPGTVENDHYPPSSPFKIADGGPYSNTWVCYEYEINITDRTTRVIITQSNGTVTEIATASDPGGLITSFQIGGYHNGYSVADPGNWLLIDNLAVSGTGYIGPPVGFVGGGAVVGDVGGGAVVGGGGGGTDNSPDPPSGIRVIGQ